MQQNVYIFNPFNQEPRLLLCARQNHSESWMRMQAANAYTFDITQKENKIKYFRIIKTNKSRIHVIMSLMFSLLALVNLVAAHVATKESFSHTRLTYTCP